MRAAGEDHLQRLAAPDHARQPLRAAAAGDDGEVDLGQAQARVRRSDADVAGQRQLQAATEAVAADGRDDRLPAAVHRAAEVEPPAALAEDGWAPAAR